MGLGIPLFALFKEFHQTLLHFFLRLKLSKHRSFFPLCKQTTRKFIKRLSQANNEPMFL
jgi:hypothetical protein